MKITEQEMSVTSSQIVPLSPDSGGVGRIAGRAALASATLAAALLMAAWAPFAHSAASIVTGRNADAIARDYGRSGGDTYWEQRQPTAVPAPLVGAYDDTKHVLGEAYQQTKAVLTQPPAQPPGQPQRYGRAGGYIGLEMFEAQPWRDEAQHGSAAATSVHERAVHAAAPADSDVD